MQTDRWGTPKHLLRIAILLDETGDEFYPAGIPMPAWEAFLALISALARLGRMLGYDPHYPEKGGSQGAKLVAAGLVGTVLFVLLRRRTSVRRAASSQKARERRRIWRA